MPGSSPLPAAVVAAVARRPGLWGAAVGAVVRHAPAGWWRGRRAAGRAGPWLRFRLETAYGAGATAPTPEDAVTWLRWCRAWPRVRR